ncbi:hypothetical protein G7077_01785 [Sphingomonas piscis]|uniref:Uncharacterized protein n=1 Tax=Sphingomonas piscis TaxID=2714943 RepID=A0A6G7YM67_9SPHN|nr:hypothetical protein [Sphingomonas piscis]QIK77831.1 hypothetical protein G7077_01785 [Sphingomonas piscis]
MDLPFISGRHALSDADELIARFGADAAGEAKTRARRSRSDGNVQRFCHWRQIERVITLLTGDEATGTIH